MCLSLNSKSWTCLENVDDPRLERNRLHKLVDILVLALCGFLSGCESWPDVELFGKSKREWFEKFLDLPNGIPSHDTFGRVFALLKPEYLVPVLQEFVRTVTGSLDGETIAIDGKTLAHSGDTAKDKKALHLVSAWATKHGVVLGQFATAQKSNEITAIPELLKILDIRGATVTIDAMGCQKAIAQQVLDQGGNYVLAVKGNQKNLHETLKFYFGPGHHNRKRSKLKTQDKNHGRRERRSYTALSAPTAVCRHWLGAQSIVRVCRRSTTHGKTSKEERFFISNLPPEAEQLARCIREHWTIENQVHWSLDVTFNEDQSRIRQGHAPENTALLRRLALSILKQDTRYSQSIRGKRLRAGWDNEALEHFLAIFLGI